jgi:dipeptidase
MQGLRSDARTFCRFVAALLVSAALAARTVPAGACTSILVTRGASLDGSVTITYSCEDPGAVGGLGIEPAADHAPGATIEIPPRIIEEQVGPGGRIPQIRHTYRILGGVMNEHQVSMAETTFHGRPEAQNPRGLLDYGPMMTFGLQRARTAREAIEVMTGLVEKYGYGDTGESISVADPREAWVFEIFGSGRGGKGGTWAAARIPDGEISCHVNLSRIGEILRNDPANFLYSRNVEDLAVSRGWYDPRSRKPFRFCDAYCPATPFLRRACALRIWSIYRRVAPSKRFSPDYALSKPGSQPYPFSVKPDHKLSVADVFALMRDHFEGTEFDMTKGLDAGPFGSPRRWGPLTWKIDGVEYAWERSVSMQQTAFSAVTQSRARLPDAIGGLVWLGLDDSCTGCYLPFYCSLESVPKSFTGGSIDRFSWDSAWWLFNVTANYAYGKYSYVMPEIRAAQKDIESNLLAIQPAVEKTAAELYKTNPKLATRYLTDYSNMHTELTVSRWRALFEHLVMKYNDGYVRSRGKSVEVGYPEAWLREVVRSRPDRFRIVPKPPANTLPRQHSLGAVGVGSDRASWATAMFDKTAHDFGVVPRGAKLEHRFLLRNANNKDVQVQSVSSGCGCTVARMDRQHLKKGEKAEILVTLDTRGSVGRRNAAVKVLFAQPSAVEVPLHLLAFVRTDVSIQPGAAQFGVIDEGTSTEQHLTLSHVGGKDWCVERIECANPHVMAHASETRRTASAVDYNVSVKLKGDAPPGYLRDQLVLVTNDTDPKASWIPISVEVLVTPPLNASPLWMGVAEPGEPVTRNLVVKGKTPFHILSIRSSDGRFKCKLPTEAKSCHVVPVTFLAKSSPVSTTRIASKIRIETDLSGAQPIEASVSIDLSPVAARKPNRE